MADRFNKPEYLNWVKCSLALTEAKKYLESFVTERFKMFVNGKLRISPESQLTAEERTHGSAYPFGPYCSFDRKKQQWLYENKDVPAACFIVFEKVKNLHVESNPGQTDLNWSNVTKPGDLHWDIAKVFMHKGNALNTGPEKTDVQNMLHIMLKC